MLHNYRLTMMHVQLQLQSTVSDAWTATVTKHSQWCMCSYSYKAQSVMHVQLQLQSTVSDAWTATVTKNSQWCILLSILQFVGKIEQSENCFAVFHSWHNDHDAEVGHDKVKIGTGQVKVHSLHITHSITCTVRVKKVAFPPKNFLQHFHLC